MKRKPFPYRLVVSLQILNLLCLNIKVFSVEFYYTTQQLFIYLYTILFCMGLYMITEVFYEFQYWIISYKQNTKYFQIPYAIESDNDRT